MKKRLSLLIACLFLVSLIIISFVLQNEHKVEIIEKKEDKNLTDSKDNLIKIEKSASLGVHLDGGYIFFIVYCFHWRIDL